MYVLTIEEVKKTYRRLGNALNAFWAMYNKTPRKYMPNMRIENSRGDCLINYTNETGLCF